MPVYGAPRDYSQTYKNAVEATMLPFDYILKNQTEQNTNAYRQQSLAQSAQAQQDTVAYQNKHLALEGTQAANLHEYQQGELTAKQREDAETARKNLVDEHQAALTGDVTRAEINARTANLQQTNQVTADTLNRQANDTRLKTELAKKLGDLNSDDLANGKQNELLSQYLPQMQTREGVQDIQAMIGDAHERSGDIIRAQNRAKVWGTDEWSANNQVKKAGGSDIEAYAAGNQVAIQKQTENKEAVRRAGIHQSNRNQFNSKQFNDDLAAELDVDPSTPEGASKLAQARGQLEAASAQNPDAVAALMSDKSRLKAFLNPPSSFDAFQSKLGKGPSNFKPSLPAPEASGTPGPVPSPTPGVMRGQPPVQSVGGGGTDWDTATPTPLPTPDAANDSGVPAPE